jgi:hypothetical protein
MLIYWRVSLVYHTVPPLLQDYNKALVIIDAAPGGVPPREEQNKMLEFKEDLDGC